MSRKKLKGPQTAWELHHRDDGTAIVGERYKIHGSSIENLFGPGTRWVPIHGSSIENLFAPGTRWVPMATSGYALVAAPPTAHARPIQWASRETVLFVRAQIGDEWIARQVTRHGAKDAEIDPLTGRTLA